MKNEHDDNFTSLQQRTLPHCLDSELFLIKELFLHPKLINQISLKSSEFYVPAHGMLFECIFSLAKQGKQVDPLTVHQELEQVGKLEQVGGVSYIAELLHSTCEATSIEKCIEKIRCKAVQRKLLTSCTEIVSKCYQYDGDVSKLISDSERELLSILSGHGKDGFVSIRNSINQCLDNLSEQIDSKKFVSGITTGFYSLDKLILGLQKKELIVVAGRPSIGKTAFALSMTADAALDEKAGVAYFSLEMSKEQVTERLMSIVAGVELRKLKSGRGFDDDDWGRTHYAAEILGKSPIIIDDSPVMSLHGLCSKIRKLKYDKNIDLVIIDYLQLMPTYLQLGVRENELSAVTRQLKALAKELDISIVVISQLNRKVDERADKRPVLSDLRGSGAIAEDADLIMFVYRDIYHRWASDPISSSEIIVAKQRNGAVGTVALQYNAAFTRFENIVELYFSDTEEETGT